MHNLDGCCRTKIFINDDVGDGLRRIGRVTNGGASRTTKFLKEDMPIALDSM